MTAHTNAYSLMKPRSWVLELPVLLAFNLLLAGCAYVTIHLPFSPVPITGQTFGVLLVAMALGRTRGTAVVAAYVMEGALGLPVFAGGTTGPAILVGPTGGYLLGFVAAAAVVGFLADRGWSRTLGLSLLAMTIGTAIIFAVGLAQLSLFVPADLLLATGFTPFLIGGAIKIALAGGVLPAVWSFLGKRG